MPCPSRNTRHLHNSDESVVHSLAITIFYSAPSPKLLPPIPRFHTASSSFVPVPGRGFRNARVAPIQPISAQLSIFILLTPPVLCDQTPRLTAQPDMRPGLSVLQPMLVDERFNLADATAVCAEGCEGGCPTMQEYGSGKV